MSTSKKTQHCVRATTGMKRGKFVSTKRKKKSDELVAENKRRKHEKTEESGLKDGARRIMDIETLAQELWCSSCEIPLSLRHRESGQQFGLAHVYSIRCMKCSQLFEVHTNSFKTDEHNHKIYDVNVLTALATIHTGTGLTKLNRILEVLDIPTLTPHFMKRYEQKVNTAIKAVVEESFHSAIQTEKALTITKTEDTQSDSTLLERESS